MNGMSRNSLRNRLLISTALLGLTLGLSGCYDDGALLRSCYHAGARCGWNQDNGNQSDSSPSSTPSPSPPGQPAAPANPTNPT